MRHFDQPPRFQRHVADKVHAAGIAVPTIEKRRHVDVDDVAVPEGPVGGNAVADDMVDRGAAALRIAAIAEGGGDRAAGAHLGEDDVVELAGGDAGHDVGDERVEDLGGDPAGGAHAGKALRAVQLDRAVTADDGVVAIEIMNVGHSADIALAALPSGRRSSACPA